MAKHRSIRGSLYNRLGEVFSVGQLSSQEDKTMNYNQRANTFTDRAHLWSWAFSALDRLAARAIDQRIERSVYLRDRGRLQDAVLRRDEELVNALYQEHLAVQARGGTPRS